ncbi:serine hydrolase [Deinococcus xianganensis]|uniref:Serine hydrolase n=1 Tax=Deinococcus xianganensis TaxID=1507289 RepID=A0A6I4YCP1_9DEIO|nr:serine hydrolase [Deinococcus xianganensis]
MPTPPLDALTDEARRSNSSALFLWQDGEVLVDEIMDGQGDRPLASMSVTKAVLSLLVGRAVTLGHLPGADLPVHEVFPEWRQGRKRDVTLRHLMTHTSGLQNVPHAGQEVYASEDRLQLALCAELDAAPGTRFSYNNKATALIAGLLERVTGQSLDAFAREELLDPLGITDWHWSADGRGLPNGFADLFLHARDLGRLGLLALRDGEDLIRADWMQDSTRPATPLNDQMGLLWFLLPAWTRYSVTAAHVQAARDAGVNDAQLQALEACTCHEATREDLLGRLSRAALVPQELPAGLNWMTVHAGPQVGFRHDGFRGQNLIVHREAELVAVRMISWDHPQVEAPASAFSAFPDRVLALAQASLSLR